MSFHEVIVWGHQRQERAIEGAPRRGLGSFVPALSNGASVECGTKKLPADVPFAVNAAVHLDLIKESIYTMPDMALSSLFFSDQRHLPRETLADLGDHALRLDDLQHRAEGEDADQDLRLIPLAVVKCDPIASVIHALRFLLQIGEVEHGSLEGVARVIELHD